MCRKMLFKLFLVDFTQKYPCQKGKNGKISPKWWETGSAQK